MSIFNLVYSMIKQDTIIANISAYLSHREINNVNLTERLHYFSLKKASIFLEASGLELPIDKKISVKGKLACEKSIKSEVEGSKEISYKISLYNEIKQALKVAKKKRLIVPYEKVVRGKYVLIHFPFYNGTMRLKTCKQYDDVYWWHGVYRDLKVYACGNKKNRIDDAGDIIEPLWDPSASSSSKEFFDKISNYVSEKNEKHINIDKEDFFEVLSSNLHEGTMRGCKKRTYQGWYVMLLRCDCVNRKYGCTEIFGSPVFVSYETPPGYGWYHICDEKNKEYYVEHYGKQGCHYLVMSELKHEQKYNKFGSKNKRYIGYNYGYQMYESGQDRKMRIIKKVSLVSKNEYKRIRIIEKEVYEEVISKIKGLRAVGLTTKLIGKKC